MNQCKHHFDGGTLFCNKYKISDNECIEFLKSKRVLENSIDSNNVDEVIDLELNLARLNSIGFYESCEIFLIKNRYELPQHEFYINELNCFTGDASEFIQQYSNVICLISSLVNISKHQYIEVDIKNLIIVRENRSTFLPLIFDEKIVQSINLSIIEKLNTIIQVFSENDTEKKILFVNELIDFLNVKNDNERFSHLITNFSDFYDICHNAYQFYLSNFSYNKLKIELDSKALEYTQKIQSVINDSQTKLITIPTAFVLVFAAFNFDNLLDVINFATLISLFVFALLIQIFLNNQKTSLNFIEENIVSYKKSFINNDIEKISTRFLLVDRELKIQKNRLILIQIILWCVPFILFLLWILLIVFHFSSIRHF